MLRLWKDGLTIRFMDDKEIFKGHTTERNISALLSFFPNNLPAKDFHEFLSLLATEISTWKNVEISQSDLKIIFENLRSKYD